MAADLVGQLLPVGMLLLGLGLTRVDRRWDRRRDAVDEATLLVAGLDEKSWKSTEESTWRPLQAHLTMLTIALRRAGAPDRLIIALRPVTEARWNAQHDSGDPEIGYYIDSDDPSNIAYNALIDALSAWLGARGLARPLKRRAATRAVEGS